LKGTLQLITSLLKKLKMAQRLKGKWGGEVRLAGVPGQDLFRASENPSLLPSHRVRYFFEFSDPHTISQEHFLWWVGGNKVIQLMMVHSLRPDTEYYYP
jgi:hypothetical protein